MKTSLFVFIFLCCSAFCRAQELNCTVKVITAQLQTADPKIFQTLQKSIYEFMNNRKWTNDNFSATERIECSILINITQEISSDKFGAQISVQSNRPIYSAGYNSTLLKWVDKDFQIQYTEYQPLEFNENNYLSNLTSVLAYYAYTIIGFDYDSFSPSAGTPYYQKAQSIVNAAQSSSEPGWKSYESLRNRYWLITNLLDTKFADVREVLYKYHREGLDKMFENTDQGRKAIDDCLNLLSKTGDNAPNSMIMQVLLQAKSDELVNIYSKATPQEKANAVQVLSKLDASNSSKYQAIMKSN
ncbi:MAG: DUF4835 family protein [Chitinophagales bacterium]